MLYSFRLQPYLQTLDQARKVCQGQTLQLITKIRKLRIKKFYNIGPRLQNLRHCECHFNTLGFFSSRTQLTLYLTILNFLFCMASNFFLRHSQKVKKTRVYVPQTNPMFVSKARSLPNKYDIINCYTRVRSCLSRKLNKLEKNFQRRTVQLSSPLCH